MPTPEDKIIIYGHQASRASRPYWLLREYGMTIGEDFLEVDTGGPVTGFNEVRDTPEFLALNPYRLIPVMVHGDVVLYESQAICQYIADLLGGPMAAQDPGERARITMYGLNSIANFEPNFLPMVFGRGGEEGRAQYTENLRPLLSALNTELAGRGAAIDDIVEDLSRYLNRNLLIHTNDKLWELGHSPDGQYLITSGGGSETADVWKLSDDGKTASHHASLSHEGDVWGIAVSADGRALAPTEIRAVPGPAYEQEQMRGDS